MLFSEKLKQLRKGYDLTQEELALKLNVSRQAITKWESGEGIPDIENLKQISILFNTTIDELIKEDKKIEIKPKKDFSLINELEIDHTKHYDINICKNSDINIKSVKEEKVKVEILSNEEIQDDYKIKFDDLYDRLDIDIKSKKKIEDVSINIYIPEKYIDEIELNTKNINLNKLEFDGSLKYLNVSNTTGKIVLNASKCDIEANYDKLDGILEINSINSTSRLNIPLDSKYKTILKGKHNEFINSINTEESENIIELNGINSKLIINK